MIKKIIFSLFLMTALSLNAQENPRIDVKSLSVFSPEPKRTKQAIRKGDRYYRKGLYDAACSNT